MMAEHSGIGMTSQRTRDRLADTLVRNGDSIRSCA